MLRWIVTEVVSQPLNRGKIEQDSLLFKSWKVALNIELKLA